MVRTERGQSVNKTEDVASCTGERGSKRSQALNVEDSFLSEIKRFHSDGFGNALTYTVWVCGTAEVI